MQSGDKNILYGFKIFLDRGRLRKEEIWINEEKKCAFGKIFPVED